MIAAEDFIEQLRRSGFGLFAGVPCSYLLPLINAVIDSRDVHYVGATNEGDAVAIACGSLLGGRRSVVMFQNSGLGNAVSPLTSLTHTFRLPVLLIVTWRGQPGGRPDEPQHELMGAITPELLQLMGIPWEIFPEQDQAVEGVISRALDVMEQSRSSYAFVMRHGAVAKRALRTKPDLPGCLRAISPTGAMRPRVRCDQDVALQAIQAHTDDDDLLIATTGYTGRALYALQDRPNQFYMVGSMGCASSLGLGLACAQPQRRVVVIDGDGAAFMRMGALATVGYQQPPNLTHILLDNGCHDSTGGQATPSSHTDLAAVAEACGYPRVVRIEDVDQLASILAARATGLSFLHVATHPRQNLKLPRPTMTPREVAVRFQKHLEHLGERSFAKSAV